MYIWINGTWADVNIMFVAQREDNSAFHFAELETRYWLSQDWGSCICLTAGQKVNVFAAATWRNGNFTPRPETQTFSIVMLKFMDSPSNHNTLAQQWVNAAAAAAENLSKNRQWVVFYTSVFISSECISFSPVMLPLGYRQHNKLGWCCQRPDHPSQIHLGMHVEPYRFDFETDKRQQHNDIKGWVCFRLSTERLDKTRAD